MDQSNHVVVRMLFNTYSMMFMPNAAWTLEGNNVSRFRRRVGDSDVIHRCLSAMLLSTRYLA